MEPVTLVIEGHEIKLDNPDKVLFPEDGITKRDLAAYYERVAPFMLPHVKDRPLTVIRYPDGIGSQGFYQKETPAYYPSYIRRSQQKKEGGITTYPIADNAASLVYLAGQTCIVMHTRLSRESKPDHPDMLIFDLDPPGDEFAPVRKAAFDLRALLEKLEVEPYVKTTGSRGLHVAVPLDAKTPFVDVRAFARRLAEYLAARDQEHLTVEERKEKRGRRVFLDILRNSYGQHAVSPYSVRALPAAPVATPLTWPEIEDRKLTSRAFNTSNIFKRLDAAGDVWRDFGRKKYSIAKMQKRFEGLE